MLTRCPRCETTFRVTPEQLKARQGKVRCGECQEVFNALDTLIEAPVPLAMPAESAAPIVQESAPIDAAIMAAPAEEAAPEFAEITTADETPAGPSYEDDVSAAPGATIEAEVADEPPAVAAPQAEPETVSTPPRAPEPAPEPKPEPESAPEPEPTPEPALAEPPPRRTWPWVLGVLAALLVLTLQAAMHFRSEIAILHPQTKPLFTAACELVACRLLLPRKAELVSIETSDLHPENGGRLGLSATLKNRAPFDQEYPHLELALTDTADRALVRRVLSPPEYLPPGMRSQPGFAAGTEMPVDLSIEVADIPAVGYRLYLFYP
jgi:predicted Zn finger-like uncharacterized protein